MNWRPWAIRITTLLIVGLLLQTAVAWYCASRSELATDCNYERQRRSSEKWFAGTESRGRRLFLSATQRLWPQFAEEQLPPHCLFQSIDAKTLLGIGVGWCQTDVMWRLQGAETQRGSADLIQCGWPLPSLESWSRCQNHGDGQSANSRAMAASTAMAWSNSSTPLPATPPPPAAATEGPPGAEPWVGAFAAPDWLANTQKDASGTAFIPATARLFPYSPIWTGLIVNTACWVPILLAPYALLWATRRGVRALRGRCARCGYDWRGLDQCPECGRMRCTRARHPVELH